MDKQPMQQEVILGVDTHLDTHVGTAKLFMIKTQHKSMEYN